MTTSFTRLLVLAGLAVCVAAPSTLSPQPAVAASTADAQKFTLDSVTFEGNQRVSTDTLNSIVGLQPGQKVDRDDVVQAFQNVIAEYKKENVGGSIQPSMRQQGHHMSVVFQITEAAPAPVTVVQPILDHETFTGNVKVSTEKLVPALTIKPGTAVTKEMVIADRDALTKVYKGANVGVMVKPAITNLPEGHIDLNFELDENPPKK
jgi:outer membrane protein assembly factor BamA